MIIGTGSPPCEVEPLYSNGWPRDLGVTSSLKNIFAYGSNLGCNINLDMNSAILLVKKELHNFSFKIVSESK